MWRPKQALTDAPPGPDALLVASNIRGSLHPAGATALWDREVFDTFGPISELSPVGDGPMFFRATLLGQTAFIDEPLVLWRTGGISFSAGEKKQRDHFSRQRMFRLRSRVGRAHAYIEDVKKTDTPSKNDIIAACEEILESKEAWEIDLAGKSAIGRICAVPHALVTSLKTQDSHFIKEASKHACRPLYRLYARLRY